MNILIIVGGGCLRDVRRNLHVGQNTYTLLDMDNEEERLGADEASKLEDSLIGQHPVAVDYKNLPELDA